MAYPLLPPRTLLDTSGNKFSSSRNGLENIFESPATKLV
jgi:hypothetical protein